MSEKWTKRIIRLLWAGFLLSFIGITSLVLMVKNDAFGWFGGMPSLIALERPDPDLSSELISADGVLLGKYFRQKSNASHV